MSEQVIQILEYLSDKFNIAIDWSSQNLAPYIGVISQKIIHWELTTSIMWLVLYTVILSIFAYIICHLWKEVKADKEFMEVEHWGFEVLLFVVIYSLLVVGKQIVDITKCFVFPEQIVWDEIQSIIQDIK